MSNDDENGTAETPTLKGKPFDEVCRLIDDGDAKISVHKKQTGSSRWDFCFTCLLDEYDQVAILEKIADEFGAGEYPVQIKGTHGDGRPKILWQENMRVVEARRAPGGPITDSQPAAGGLDALARAMADQTALLAAVLEKVSQPPPAAPPQQTREDFAKEMVAMKELFSDNKPSGLDSFRELLEVQKLMVEATGGDSDPLSQAIKTLGPKIVEGIDAANRRNELAASRPAAKSHQEVTAMTQPTEEQKPRFAHINTDSAYSIFAEQYLSQLMAIEGSPEEIGKYMASRVGDDQQLLHIVGLVIAQDDMVERLAQFDARVMDKAEWLDTIADWLAHALWPDTNAAPTPESATNSATIVEKPDSQGISSSNGEGVDNDETVGEADEPGSGTP